ncbi:hypothetical protein D210916BOD24_02800 [Alteromonas sp. D210916BOD_24]|uniref:DUF4019 domain-containing protein n=1 Tax=Alteromonas sp. D210916BOD_24 TaxID=3157618 RepID=UPI00399CBEA2
MEMKIDTHKLIKLRNAKAWSQQHLADVSGLSLRTIQRIEKTQSASQESVKAIAAVFDTTPDDILLPISVGASLPANEKVDGINTSRLLTPASAFQRHFLMWWGVAIVLSFCVAVYWSQSVKATNAGSQVIESGAPVEISDMALAQATDWLALIDSEQYTQSWRESAAIFRANVTQAKWSEAMVLVRKPLGVVKSRELVMAQSPASLPGLPAGEYLILSFVTEFDAKPSSATETLSLEKRDGVYRAIGYFIK